MAAPSCVLESLANPLLNGLILGLSVHDDFTLKLQPNMFPCCAAEGHFHDHLRGVTHRCQLTARLRRVQALLDQYRSLWSADERMPHQASPQWVAATLQELVSVFKHDRPSATLSQQRDKQHPSVLWSKALASCWRFGIETRVLNLLRSDTQKVVRFTQAHQGPLALFVEHVGRLWDPPRLEALEYIIQQAYNAQAFLWLDFVTVSKDLKDEPHDMSFMASVSRRIAKLRPKIPLSFYHVMPAHALRA